MLRKARPPRAVVLACLAVMASLWLPQATAQGQAAASRAAASPADGPAGPAGINLASVRWLRHILAGVTVHRGSTPLTAIQTGNFSSCPKLRQGDDPSQWTCLIVHITGGVLQMGGSTQLINRDITVTFAYALIPSINKYQVIWGGETAAPMPVPGGIFLQPLVDNLTQPHPDLRLEVQPVGLGVRADQTGMTPGFLSMKFKLINPAFGNNCFIGSDKKPVILDPTFQTTSPPPPNQPISGHADYVSYNGVDLVVIGTTVDNAFAAQGAHGCGPHGGDLLDKVIDEVGGLPSAAGTNTAAFQVTGEAVAYTNLPS